MTQQISFVVTSCGRFDLLEEALSSFFRHNRAAIARYIVVEDSGDSRVAEIVRKYEPSFVVLVNNPKLGQLRSIDRAYAEVETPYIFHCEDDWRFLRGGFIEEALVILENFPNLSAVAGRRRGQNKNYDKRVFNSPLTTFRGIDFRTEDTRLTPPWGGYTFNPTLVRLSGYRALAPFARFDHEADISADFANRGMSLASLENPAFETIGHGRHLEDPFVGGAYFRGHDTWKTRMKRGLHKAAARFIAQKS